jgi:hypothetical protein
MSQVALGSAVENIQARKMVMPSAPPLPRRLSPARSLYTADGPFSLSRTSLRVDRRTRPPIAGTCRHRRRRFPGQNRVATWKVRVPVEGSDLFLRRPRQARRALSARRARRT